MLMFKALEEMPDSLLATTIPVRELRQFTEALLAAARADGVQGTSNDQQEQLR
ncbi:MAG TPA: hypothetical protein VGE22_12435 [Solimonas sp.]